jgi:hypothetical protein
MEITIIYKQSGTYWTAAAFVGGAFAGCAVSGNKQQAGNQARALAEHLVLDGQPTSLDPEAARLGGRAKVGSFSVQLNVTRQPLGIMQAAQLAALAVPFLPTDEAGAADAVAA